MEVLALGRLRGALMHVRVFINGDRVGGLVVPLEQWQEASLLLHNKTLQGSANASLYIEMRRDEEGESDA